MLFVELRFFLFFAVVLTLYWKLGRNEHRKWLLLAASYFFYGSWDWRFAAMLFVLSFADYLFARRIEDSEDLRTRRRYVAASVGMNLSVLGFFKYFNFFIDSAMALGRVFGLELGRHELSIVLPVGISFFTFQSLSYTIDVYRGDIKATRKASDYLLFAAFFPQLVAGPIVRPKMFLPQLLEKRSVDLDSIKFCIALFSIGFIKKACIADNVSPYVDQVFAAPEAYSNLACLTAVWLYAVQIYCDFSGYTDMAIAVAGFMGYKLAINFNAPYLATSLQDFWRRWHISLSTWIRDYIYFSLGGRSARRIITYRNLMLTMLAGGLWHGAAWTFVFWGGLHGLGQVIQQEFGRRCPGLQKSAAPVWTVCCWLLTIHFVLVCWIFFRASDFGVAAVMLSKFWHLAADGPQQLPLFLVWVAPVLLLVQWAFSRLNLEALVRRSGPRTLSLGVGAVWALAIALLPLAYRPFIYFQF